MALGTWRKQLTGTNDYRVAVETLKAALGFKDAMAFLRRPWVGVEEWSGRQRRPNESPAEMSVLDTNHAYYERLQAVREAHSRLIVARLEARAHWGKVADEHLEPLDKAMRDVRTAYQQYFRREVNAAKQNRELGDDKLQQRLHRTLFACAGEDEVGTSIQTATEEIERWLRPSIERLAGAGRGQRG
jgi:uncharacterized protein YdcH (DUF465 family)